MRLWNASIIVLILLPLITAGEGEEEILSIVKKTKTGLILLKTILTKLENHINDTIDKAEVDVKRIGNAYIEVKEASNLVVQALNEVAVTLAAINVTGVSQQATDVRLQFLQQVQNLGGNLTLAEFVDRFNETLTNLSSSLEDLVRVELGGLTEALRFPLRNLRGATKQALVALVGLLDSVSNVFGTKTVQLWSETLAAKVLTLLQSFEKLEPAAVKVLDGDVSALQLESEYWVLNRSGGLFNPIIISIEETITEDGRLMYDLHKTKYSLIDGISESERFKMVEEVN